MWCPAAIFGLSFGSLAHAASLSEKARESGCVGKAIAISGELYKCQTASGTEAFFNVPGAVGTPPAGNASPRRPDTKATTNTPAGFPRVDADTQKGRDDLRRKVLSDELASEEKLLGEARIAYDNGAPAPLPEEKSDAEKYRQRIARLREAVQLHQRNVDALKKELGSTR